MDFNQVVGLRQVKPHGYAGIEHHRPARPGPAADPVEALAKMVGRKKARRLMEDSLLKEARELEDLARTVSDVCDSEGFRRLAAQRRAAAVLARQA